MKPTLQPTTNTLSSPVSVSSISALRFAPNSIALGLLGGSEDHHVFASYSCERIDQLIHWNHPEVNFL
jgi:hypothetical protein